MITPASSITYQHLLSIVHTELTRRGPKWANQPLRLLDAGCGDGRLIGYLQENLPLLQPDVSIEIHGFDVGDHGVQPHDFFHQTLENLNQRHPSIPWNERLQLISQTTVWPYADGFFDIILSNQVLEHVDTPDHFFGQVYRTLRSGGIAVHLFPLKHYIYEGHLHLPLVHRIANYDFLRAYIRLLSRLRLGKFPTHRRVTGISLADYVQKHADYMHHLTHYLSQRQVLALGKRHHLRSCFRYTTEFYSSKLLAMLGYKPRYTYRTIRSLKSDWLAVFLLRYLSSITLFLEKENQH